MDKLPWIDQLPLLGLFLAVAVLLLFADEIGLRSGRARRLSATDADGKGSGSGVSSALLGLLAFMLAFTFGMAANRFADRKALVVEEANAIGTTHLRSRFLPEPQATASAGLLREYVNVRVDAIASKDPRQLGAVLGHSEEIHGKLWTLATEVAKRSPDSIMVGLYVQSLNEVIDLHAKRVAAGLRSRIPLSIWLTLCFVALVGMAVMGYDAGLSGIRTTLAKLALVLSIAAVLLLIVDLDRPHQDLFTVSQQAMIDLQQQLNRPG